MINIDLDSERNRNVVTSKPFPIGDPNDGKEYAASGFMAMRQQPFMQFRGESTEMWKANRRLPSQQPPPPPQPVSAHANKPPGGVAGPGVGRSAPDERQIIRMSQPPSPRSKSSAPAENYHYMGAPCGVPQSPSPHRFDIINCYMKNRIVEVMRTEDDKRAEEANEAQRRTPQQRPAHHAKDDRSSTPGDMVIDEEPPQQSIPSSMASRVSPHIHHGHPAHHNSQFAQPPVTTFATTTYAYPFSALNVAPAPLPPPIKSTIDGEPPTRANLPLPPAQEPKPLLSAQYEALSDED